MTKILVISAHQDLQQSISNRLILADLEQHFGSDLSVRRLSDLYPDYRIDVAAEQAALVEAELRERLTELDAAGVDRSQVILDPGLGFAKTHAQSWELLAATPRLIEELGRPLLIGASRKRFLARAAEEGAAPVQRDAVTAATTALAAAAGAWAVRVHEVPVNRAAVRTASLWKEHQ